MFSITAIALLIAILVQVCYADIPRRPMCCQNSKKPTFVPVCASITPQCPAGFTKVDLKKCLLPGSKVYGPACPPIASPPKDRNCCVPKDKPVGAAPGCYNPITAGRPPVCPQRSQLADWVFCDRFVYDANGVAQRSPVPTQQCLW